MKYKCDVPMAKKKGIYRRCNKKCVDCLCGMRINEMGVYEHHADYQQGVDPNFAIKNLLVMSWRTTYE